MESMWKSLKNGSFLEFSPTRGSKNWQWLELFISLNFHLLGKICFFVEHGRHSWSVGWNGFFVIFWWSMVIFVFRWSMVLSKLLVEHCHFSNSGGTLVRNQQKFEKRPCSIKKFEKRPCSTKIWEATMLHWKIWEATMLHRKILEATMLHKIWEATMLHRKIWEATILHRKIWRATVLHRKIWDATML